MDEIIILLEKKRKNVTHDGMLKKILEEVAHLCSHLLAMRSLLDEEESPKDSSGWEEKAKKVAASEQGTSKGEDRSLPRSNKKCKRKTCSSKFAVMKHMCQWMLPFLLFGTPVTADNVYLQREDFRKIVIARDETQIATDPILRRDDYLVYFVFAIDGNDDRIGYECTPDFVSTNQSCRIVAGDRSRAECEGLQISMNGSYTYLAVDGSKLTYDHTTFCILQRVALPGSPILYPLGVFKKHDQDIAQQESPTNTTTAPNKTVDATEPVPTSAPKTNRYEVAFYILLSIVLVILMVIAITIKTYFTYMPRIRAWWKKELMKPVPVPTNDPDRDQTTTALEDLEMRNGHVA